MLNRTSERKGGSASIVGLMQGIRKIVPIDAFRIEMLSVAHKKGYMTLVFTQLVSINGLMQGVRKSVPLHSHAFQIHV